MTFWDFMLWSAIIAIAGPIVIAILMALVKGFSELFSSK